MKPKKITASTFRIGKIIQEIYRAKMKQPKYSITLPDFKDHQDSGVWRSYELQAEGNTLQELLDSAVYYMVDQDGGELGFKAADDADAVSYINTYFDLFGSSLVVRQ